jgi:hypothetical protein
MCKHYGGDGLPLGVLADDRFQVEVCEHVAVKDDRRLANQVLGELVGPGRAHRLRLDRVFELNAEVRAVA